MRVKIWFSSQLLILVVVAVSLLVSCTQDEPVNDAGSTAPDDQNTNGARLITALLM
jgi:hypothetical protein